jgi:hypothetical protein
VKKHKSEKMMVMKMAVMKMTTAGIRLRLDSWRMDG